MKKFKEFISEVKNPTGDLKNACWKGYTAIGTKKKNGKTVPNCVPEEYIAEEQEYFNRPEMEDKIGKRTFSSIMKHPFFQSHVAGTGNEPKFRHSKLNDTVSNVDAISTPDRYVSFDLWGKGKNQRIANAHIWKWDGKSRNSEGRKLWFHHKSFHSDED